MVANTQNHYAYNRDLQLVANMLRKTLTKAGACLWKYALRAGEIRGYHFRRQRPVLEYVADFMCMELMLIIEVDGNIHNLPDVAANDLKRQAQLEAIGFTILRFKNTEVLQNMAGVKRILEDRIDNRLAL